MNLDGYEVTKYGSVISHKYSVPKVLKSHLNSGGYPCVSINGIKLLVHRVVMYVHAIDVYHFPYCGFEVNHINEVKTDACVDNLEWATRSENISHSSYKISAAFKKLSKVIITDDELNIIDNLIALGESIEDITRIWLTYRKEFITVTKMKSILNKRSE